MHPDKKMQPKHWQRDQPEPKELHEPPQSSGKTRNQPNEEKTQELEANYKEILGANGSRSDSENDLKFLELKGLEEEEIFFKMVRNQREKVI